MNRKHTFAILFWVDKRRQKNGFAPIYTRITVDGERAEISTNRQAPVSEWNSKAQMILGKSNAAKEINNHLISVKAKLLQCHARLETLNDAITATAIKNEYLGKRAPQKKCIEVFAEYNQQLKLRVFAPEPTLKEKTWKRFETTKDKLSNFIKFKFNKGDLALDEITEAFGDEFLLYLTTKGGISKNTAMKYLKNTKQMIDWARRKRYLKEHPMEGFKCSYKQPKRVRLTWNELIHLYQHKMPVKRLEEVRDVYIFSCFTGYSYMDIYELEPENVLLWIDGTKWLIRDRYKGDHNKSNVPLLDIPLEIIEKYKDHPYCKMYNKLLPVNSNQRYNSYLKEIAAVAGINKNLTTHTARHTFATTILLENDCPIESASEMLGHGSIRTTQIYAQVTDMKVSYNMKEVKQRIANRLRPIKTGS